MRWQSCWWSAPARHTARASGNSCRSSRLFPLWWTAAPPRGQVVDAKRFAASAWKVLKEFLERFRRGGGLYVRPVVGDDDHPDQLGDLGCEFRQCSWFVAGQVFGDQLDSSGHDEVAHLVC
jgi:hypothetical protein